MYKSGELDRVMNEFEKALKVSPVYVGGSVDRADKVEIDQPDGTIAKRYRNQNYYNNGNVNQLFVMYLSGYANGKLEGRNDG